MLLLRIYCYNLLIICSNAGIGYFLCILQRTNDKANILAFDSTFVIGPGDHSRLCFCFLLPIRYVALLYHSRRRLSVHDGFHVA